MVQRGEVYHPLRWTPREARDFLKEVPAREAAGVVVRVPDWWNARTPPQPQVQGRPSDGVMRVVTDRDRGLFRRRRRSR